MNTKCPDKLEFIKIFEKSLDIHEVASYYNVSWGTIRCWLRWMKINFRPNRDILLKLCEEFTDKEIGKKYKVTDRTVIKWKKEYYTSKNLMRMDKFPSQLLDVQKE